MKTVASQPGDTTGKTVTSDTPNDTLHPSSAPDGLLFRLTSIERALLGLRDDLTTTLKTSGIDQKLDDMRDCLKTLQLNALQGSASNYKLPFTKD